MLIPAIITLEDGRKEARVSPDPPGFISAIFRWGKDPVKSQPYELDVLNCSEHGLALLLTEKDHHSLSSLKPGDRISGMTLFAASALTVVNGTVRHKTFIEDGPYQGCFVIGLETRADLSPANRKSRRHGS